jgi:hypothetical protein
MPSKLRRDTLLGLKMPASWRNEKKTKKLLYLLISGPTDFLFFGGHIFRQLKSILMPPELPG